MNEIKNIAAAGLLIATQPVFAVVVLDESFENNSQFTTNEAFFSDGSRDYFGLAGGAGGDDFGGDPSPSGLKSYSGLSGGFLTGQDLDGEGATPPFTVTWSNLDIGGLSNLTFSGSFAEFFDPPGDIDSTEFVTVEYQIDGGGFNKIVDFRLDESEPDSFNGVFREDTDGDGRGDGATLGSAATTFVKSIAGSGSQMDLRLSVSLDAGDEDFAVDNFLLTGDMSAEVVLDETFSDDSQFTTNEAFFSDGSRDYFGLAVAVGVDDFGGDPSPSGLKPYSGFSGGFLTGQDLDGEGAGLPFTVTWSGLDTAGLSGLVFSGDFAEFFDSPGDIDATDFLAVEYQVDGGGFEELLGFRLDVLEPDLFNGIFREDTDGDGRGDGAALGDAATTFTKTIANLGTELDLRLVVSLNAGDEDFAVDNFRLIALRDDASVPEPATFIMLAAGMAFIRVARRRRGKPVSAA